MSWPASVLLSLVTTGEAPDYQRDVRPILSDRCFTCHGPDAAARKAGLRLDASKLLPISRWITPAMASRRFDTLFFLARRVPEAGVLG